MPRKGLNSHFKFESRHFPMTTSNLDAWTLNKLKIYIWLLETMGQKMILVSYKNLTVFFFWSSVQCRFLKKKNIIYFFSFIKAALHELACNFSCKKLFNKLTNFGDTTFTITIVVFCVRKTHVFALKSNWQLKH